MSIITLLHSATTLVREILTSPTARRSEAVEYSAGRLEELLLDWADEEYVGVGAGFYIRKIEDAILNLRTGVPAYHLLDTHHRKLHRVGRLVAQAYGLRYEEA